MSPRICGKPAASPMLMRAPAGRGSPLHGDCMTVTGKTIAENLQAIVFDPNRRSSFRSTRLWHYSRRGPERQSHPEGRHREDCRSQTHQHKGPGRVFDCEEDCFDFVQARHYREGDVLVIRWEDTKAVPACAEILSTTAALYGRGWRISTLITDGRFPARELCVTVAIEPEAADTGSDRPSQGRRYHHRCRKQRVSVTLRSRTGRAQARFRPSRRASGPARWRYAEMSVRRAAAR